MNRVNDIFNRTPFDGNVGGIDQILFIPVDYLTSLPRTGRVNIKSIVPAADSANGGWRVAEFVRETSKYNEEGATGSNGPYTKIKVSFEVAKHYEGRVADMLEMREREFAVAVFDKNGVGRLIAEINLRGERKGMIFHEDNTTNAVYADRNNYSCYFYSEWNSKARIAYYTGARILNSLPVDDIEV